MAAQPPPRDTVHERETIVHDRGPGGGGPFGVIAAVIAVIVVIVLAWWLITAMGATDLDAPPADDGTSDFEGELDIDIDAPDAGTDDGADADADAEG